MSKIVIFTDGASKGNPGPGGWGAIVATDSSVVELGGGEKRTTNNRMELLAAFRALERAKDMDATAISMYADSAYVIGGATKWGAGWRRNGWITSTKQPVLNRDLWEPFLDLLDEITAPIEWQNVGGHVGVPGNERCDEIAVAFAAGDAPELYRGNRTGYGTDISHVRKDAALAGRKSASKSRTGKAFSYVSEVDGEVMTHKTWAECEARVRGKKARFKKALSAQEEADLVRQFSQ